MRIRTVKPSYFTDARLFRLEKASGLPIRLAYEGLWCAADREGRLSVDPDELKAKILPFDDVDFERILGVLEEGGRIKLYKVAGDRYAWIPKFADHQSINFKEAASTLPGYDERDEASPLAEEPSKPVVVQAQGETERVPERVESPATDAKATGEEREAQGDDSREGDALTTREARDEARASDALSLVVEEGGKRDDDASAKEGKGKEGKGKKGKELASPDELAEAFTRFWDAYPPRAGDRKRAEAEKKFGVLVRSGTDPERIIAGSARYAAFCDATRKTKTEFVQQAPTWLNGKAWENEWEIPDDAPGRSSSPSAESVRSASERRKANARGGSEGSTGAAS